MTTRDTVESYFADLRRRADWKTWLADDVEFRSLTSPGRTLSGRESFVEGTRRFYASIAGFEVRELLVDGDRVCAFTRYTIKPPTGAPTFQSDVAELFEVENGRIKSFSICFDTAPYPK